MSFRYNETIDKLSLGNCPPLNYEPKNIKAFRWIYDTDNVDNFKPQYFKNPKRFLTKTEKEQCSSLALSMFDTLDNAIKRFDELRTPLGEKIYQVLGGYVAEGTISYEDGVNGNIDNKGHFNHHPYTNTEDYNNSFKKVHNLDGND